MASSWTSQMRYDVNHLTGRSMLQKPSPRFCNPWKKALFCTARALSVALVPVNKS
jgi:hypothetical protein